MWTATWDSRFEKACAEQAGLDKAKPKRTLELMDCEGEQGAPTKEHISLHLFSLRRAKKNGQKIDG